MLFKKKNMLSSTLIPQKKRTSMLDIKRLDPLGLVAGTIKNLGLAEFIDSHFEQDDKKNISTGEAIAGMIINGFGFTQRPMQPTCVVMDSKGYTEKNTEYLKQISST